MKTILMIVAGQNFRDEELFQPKEMFEKAGFTVKIASASSGEVKGMLGSKVKPDISLSEVAVRDYDAVVFVGGGGAAQYFNDSTAHQIARETSESGRVLAAICIAPVILAKAGVLKGKRATVWSSGGTELQTSGARYTGEKVVRDGNIITGDGPFSALPFAREIFNALQ
ncbi:MAG: DJ-1/PfpI family protein [Candidatus Omnitrophica bacterium]|nr:DJ-1/PfpI family protein [Candidatus Omnitrophota bacterium]